MSSDEESRLPSTANAHPPTHSEEEKEDKSSTPAVSEVAMRIGLFGKLIIPPPAR
jgi:hypothetical protein